MPTGKVNCEAELSGPGCGSSEPACRWIYPEGCLSRSSGGCEEERPRLVLGRLLSGGVGWSVGGQRAEAAGAGCGSPPELSRKRDGRRWLWQYVFSRKALSPSDGPHAAAAGPRVWSAQALPTGRGLPQDAALTEVSFPVFYFGNTQDARDNSGVLNEIELLLPQTKEFGFFLSLRSPVANA